MPDPQLAAEILDRLASEERDLNNLGGGTDSPTGWFCKIVMQSGSRTANWLVVEDSRGIVSIQKFATPEALECYFQARREVHEQWLNGTFKPQEKEKTHG